MRSELGQRWDEIAAKRSKKTPLTRTEQREWRRFELLREEFIREWQCAELPQKVWREWSGRQTKVLHEQAALYNIPFDRAHINLPSVARAVHDLLAKKARQLSEDDELFSGDSKSPALERWREAKANHAELDYLERQRELVPRELIRDMLADIATILRKANEKLQTLFGNDAHEVLHDALLEAELAIDQRLNDPHDHKPDPAADSRHAP